MKHKFERDGIVSEVYLMDCLEGMKLFPEKHFDLACVDPPYGSGNIKGGYTSGNGGGNAKVRKYNQSLWEMSKPSTEYFDALLSASKNQIIWGLNHFVSRFAIDSPGWIFWDKKNGGVSFSDGELAYTSFNSGLRKFAFRWSGMLQENMKNKEIRVHPTQKPVALYDWIFKHYTNPGQWVIDTHLGSGSSRIAAEKAGLNFIGFEVVEEYFNDSVERFKAHVKQTRLPLESAPEYVQKNLI